MREWAHLDVKEGRNLVALPSTSNKESTTVRIVVADYEKNRVELLGFEVDEVSARCDEANAGTS